jgi:hypothetical protein
VPLKNACKYYFFHMHDFIFDSFVVTPVLTLPSPCNLLFVCSIPSSQHTAQVGLDIFPLSAIHSNLVQHACFLLPNNPVATKVLSVRSVSFVSVVILIWTVATENYGLFLIYIFPFFSGFLCHSFGWTCFGGCCLP